MQLSKEQLAAVNSVTKKVIVFSCAASGKTRMMTEKVRQLLKDGVKPSKIAVITFTNLAASELRERLGDDFADGLFVGTVHSLANHMLMQGGIDTTRVRNEENFEELFELVKDNPECIRELDYILLDEAQDSSLNQCDFIFNRINPKGFFVVGDFRQLIYNFGNAPADPYIIRELMKDDEVKVFTLRDNYRNGQKIIDYSHWILGLMEEPFPRNTNCKTGVLGTVQSRVSLSSLISGRIKFSKNNYNEWFILCRTNGQVSNVMYELSRAGIPAVTFKQAGKNSKNLQKLMKENSVKVLTIHSAKGLEADNVVVIGNKMNTETDKRISYVACTRARKNLFWAY